MRARIGGLAAVGLLAPALALAHHDPGAAAPNPYRPPTLDAGAIRQDYAWAGSRLVAESFWLAPDLTERLVALPLGDRLLVTEFPVAPGERATVELERFEVYAPGARIVVVDENGEREVPRAPRAHLLGTALQDPRVRVGLSIDPDGRRLSGLVAHPTGTHGVRELDESAGGPPLYEIGKERAVRIGVRPRTTCDTPGHPQFFEPALAEVFGGGPQPHSAGELHLATLAFDTDGELIVNMFGGSPAATNSALGDFVTATNVIYERDLSLRLLQGETVLNANPATDPYSASSTGAQLDEVEEWWATNRIGTPRTFVALISGKSPSMFSGAGIAWLDEYCNEGSVPAGGGSYSATQVLRAFALDSPINIGLLDHEIGHNAGSEHTHCYSPEVDQCYRAEPGCYSGPVSCPDWSALIPGITAGSGTMMSYCHFDAPNGADCDTENFFHPTVSANIKSRIDVAHFAGCITHVSSCTVGDDELDVSGTATGAANHEACEKITYAGWTATGTAVVNARSPLVVIDNDVEIGGQFSSETVVP